MIYSGQAVPRRFLSQPNMLVMNLGFYFCLSRLYLTPAATRPTLLLSWLLVLGIIRLGCCDGDGDKIAEAEQRARHLVYLR